ncbi:DUF4982 domain-containing protein (plasmid) [Sphingomonas aliaeris]|uniref:DUF4982 domain-containing protein n=2 Tax=Sphingomonas aliaeris TaxID=2759526 RepID=A0A974NYM5_9SPHN|nr:DUF4982 domain-containing protein [Sphingomonas aliaeris]
MLLGGALIAGPLAGQGITPTVTAAHATAGERVEIALGNGWRFKQDDTLRGAEIPTFDDRDWAHVSVPHTWNRVGYYLPDTPQRVNTPAIINKTQGVGWYRLSFAGSPALRDKRVWLEFDAASRIATVWLNGVNLGEHKGGFSRFRLNATRALRLDGPNVLAVRVDNSKPELGSSTADVLPLTGDFFVHGGLYRPVRLVATDPVHLDMLDAGGPGIRATTDAIVDGTARITVASKIRNDAAKAQALTVVTRLIEASGRVAGEQTTDIRLQPATGSAATATLNIPRAHLWQGVDNPYLYRLSVEIRGRDGRVRDRLDQPFGIRQMRFDPGRGFLLNGKSYPLRGVGYHQDREGKGWAVTAADIASDLATLREMGANSIRLTHYQHGQPVHDEADRLGLILWDEIPLVSAWTVGTAQQASPGLLANVRQQLTEMIRQNENHASVAAWGIANEVDFGNSLPGFLVDPSAAPPDPLPILRELNSMAKATDPSRPTAMANCCEGQVFAPGVTVPITAPEADLAGANRYFGWYYGTPDLVGAAMDALHAKRPEQPLSISEYGAGGAISMHTDDVLGGPIESRGRTQPEEYESYVHERNWAILATKPYLFATWLWAGFDFASTVRHEGDAEDVNTKGLVTYDRAIRKDPFYFYKANWSTNPTVHITGRRYVDRAYPVTDVKVYSNAPRTELFLNGVPVGTLSDCPQRTCVWRDVKLKAGENDIVARGAFSQNPVEDRIAWSVAPEVTRSIRIDSGALVAAKASSGRFGSDAFFEGGTSATLDVPGGFNKPPIPAKIAGTPDPAVASTYRKGSFGYRVPLADGRYSVTLTFVEPTLKAGERVFDVLAGERTALRALDVVQAAGAPMTAVRLTFPATAKGGVLRLQFRPVKGEAIVSAVEVTAGAPPLTRRSVRSSNPPALGSAR